MLELVSLADADLDAAVARAELAVGQVDVKIADGGVPTILTADGGWDRFRPSVSWTHAGPPIERAWPAIVARLEGAFGPAWAVRIGEGGGGDLLRWFMRAYVTSMKDH